MILYHGSTVAVDEPRILESDAGRDFGFAFYTTDIKAQSERWAVRRAKYARKGGQGDALAVVSEYDFDEKAARASLKVKDYPAVSLDWLDMVVKCRSSLTFKHGFDIMTGKIANDTVGEVVSYVVAGVMPREMALEKLKFQQINNQIAFCSPASLRFLKFIRSYEPEVEL